MDIKDTLESIMDIKTASIEEKWASRDRILRDYNDRLKGLEIAVDKLEVMVGDSMQAIMNLNERLSNLNKDAITPLSDDDIEGIMKGN